MGPIVLKPDVWSPSAEQQIAALRLRAARAEAAAATSARRLVHREWQFALGRLERRRLSCGPLTAAERAWHAELEANIARLAGKLAVASAIERQAAGALRDLSSRPRADHHILGRS